MIATIVLDIDTEIRSKMLKYGSVWQCNDCDYKSQKSCNVYKHIESRHVEPQLYECLFCAKILRGINSFNVHMSNSHRDVKNK